MRLQSWAGRMPALLVALGGLLAAGSAATATLTCGTATGYAGQTVNVAIATTDLTPDAVVAYQFKLSYNAGIVTAVGVSTSGTLTGAAGWGTPTFGVTSGQVSVGAAGSTALAGAGTLLNLSFTINPAQLSSGSTTLTFSGVLLNEGVPAATTVNGSVTVLATPVISVAPNTGEIVRGSTLQFTVSGGVTAPVTWTTTDPSVASISAGGLLTGVTPGAVRVVAVDAAARRDTSNGDVLVRGMGVTVGTASAGMGQTVSVPVSTTTLTGLGVCAGELKVQFDNTRLSFVSATAPPGTLLHGAGGLAVGTSVNGSATTLTIVTGGSNLSGAGTLFNLDMATSPTVSGLASLNLLSALFNETMPARLTSGSVTVTAPATFGVSPATVTLLAGQQRQFTLTGSPVPPVTWSTLDPAVATIDGTGMLNAVAGGTTRVRAADASGGVALNTSVTVYDFGLTAATMNAAPGQTVQVPLRADRDLGPLHVYAVELALAWPATWITSATPAASGAINTWGTPLVVTGSGYATVTAAGGRALTNGTYVPSTLNLTLSPATPLGTDIPVTISSALFNEGHPSALLTHGVVRVRAGVDAPYAGDPGFTLGPAVPNPASAGTRFAFSLPSSTPANERVRLEVLAIDGRRVRTLCDEPLGPGPHERAWDARDAGGRAVAPGVYVVRLEAAGSVLKRKVVLVR